MDRNHDVYITAVALYPYRGSLIFSQAIDITIPDFIYEDELNYEIDDPISNPSMESLGTDAIRTLSGTEIVEECMHRILYFIGIEKHGINKYTEDYSPNDDPIDWLTAIWDFVSNLSHVEWSGTIIWSTDEVIATQLCEENRLYGWNCRDYAGLLTSMARKVGIPARLVITSYLSTADTRVTAMHCLAEFWIDSWKVISIKSNNPDCTGRVNWASNSQLIKNHYTWGFSDTHANIVLKNCVVWTINGTNIELYGEYYYTGTYGYVYDYAYPVNYCLDWDEYDDVNEIYSYMDVDLNPVAGDKITVNAPISGNLGGYR